MRQAVSYGLNAAKRATSPEHDETNALCSHSRVPRSAGQHARCDCCASELVVSAWCLNLCKADVDALARPVRCGADVCVRLCGSLATWLSVSYCTQSCNECDETRPQCLWLCSDCVAAGEFGDVGKLVRVCCQSGMCVFCVVCVCVCVFLRACVLFARVSAFAGRAR